MLAERCELHVDQICDLENAEIDPPLDCFDNLADGLGVERRPRVIPQVRIKSACVSPLR